MLANEQDRERPEPSYGGGTSKIVNDPTHPEDGGGGYDAVMVLSFGGPEAPEDVEPFLANVTAGRGVPPERLAAVASQYQQLGGASPLNDQCRRLRVLLAERLAAAGQELPVYWGNRNWSPYVADTVAEMAAAGHRRVLAVVTSAYSSYSGCRQYLEDIDAARKTVGINAPVIHKVRAYFDHPGFVEPFADSVAQARGQLPAELQDEAHLVFTAHSIPVSMAAACDYEQQLQQTARLVATLADFDTWTMAWQSRSGPPSVPWLEPDINDHLHELAAMSSPGAQAVVLAPIGFVTDHTEVLWDLDVEASATAAELGMSLARAVTPGTVPDDRFVAMWHELVQERLDPSLKRRGLGGLAVRPDFCPDGCCISKPPAEA